MKTVIFSQNLLENNDLLSTVIIPRMLDKNPLMDISDKSINKKMITLPLDKKPEKLWLYFEGEKGGFLGPEADYPNYFTERGYEVLENPAPSVLVDATNQLYEIREVLWKLNIPTDVNIILIGTPPLFTDFGLECFLNAKFTSDGYFFQLISADRLTFSDSVFVVKKK